MRTVAQCSTAEEAWMVVHRLEFIEIRGAVWERERWDRPVLAPPPLVTVNVPDGDAARAIEMIEKNYPSFALHPTPADFLLCPTCSEKSPSPETFRPPGPILSFLVLIATRLAHKTFCPSCRRLHSRTNCVVNPPN